MNSQPKDDGKPIARPEGQFLKRIVLETPNSPEVFSLMKSPPEVDVSCEETFKVIDQENGIYESHISIKSKASVKQDDMLKIAFSCEVEYCGIFTIKNLTSEQTEQALLIEAPTLLFPFARRVIATATTDAGFPPLMVAPINFAEKYKKSKEDKK